MSLSQAKRLIDLAQDCEDAYDSHADEFTRYETHERPTVS